MVFPSPGVEEAMAIALAGLSRLLRLMAVNIARIASAADEVLRSSACVTILARWPAEPLAKGTMPSTATPVAFSTWEAEHSVELLGGNRARHAEQAANDEGSEQAGLVLGRAGCGGRPSIGQDARIRPLDVLLLAQFLEAVEEALIQGAIGLRLALELLQFGFVLTRRAPTAPRRVRPALELLLLGLGRVELGTNGECDALGLHQEAAAH